MHSSFVLFSLLPLVFSAPNPTNSPAPTEVILDSSEPIPTSTLLDELLPTPLSVSESPENYDPSLFVEPPPIFDPPEPRPETLFDSPNALKSDGALRPPPLAQHRTERMSKFDGAHMHPDDTPYRPELESGCGIAGVVVRVVAFMAVLMSIVFLTLKVGRAAVAGCRRRRGLRLEEEESEEERLWPGEKAEDELSYSDSARESKGMARSRSTSKAASVAESPV